jgi:arylsulfatase A
MKRKTKPLWIAAGLFVSALLSVADQAAPNAAAIPGKPNVIYILADDLGYGDLSCYGQKKL